MRIQTTAHQKARLARSDDHPASADDALETVLSGLGGQICPSLSGMLERLIDRQAADAARGVRP